MNHLWALGLVAVSVAAPLPVAGDGVLVLPMPAG